MESNFGLFQFEHQRGNRTFGILKLAFRVWIISFGGLGIGFHRTGADTEQLVRHAKAEHAGSQHNHTQPAPGTDGAHRSQDYQSQSGDDAKNAVYTAYVFSHCVSLNGKELIKPWRRSVDTLRQI